MNNAKISFAATDRDDGEFGVVDLLMLLSKYKKGITLFVLGIVVTAMIVSRILPDVYLATTRLLPPQQTQANSVALMATLGVALGSRTSLPNLKGKGDLYVGILKSRTIADALVARFGLQKVYDEPTREKARRRLQANTVVISDKDGSISVHVEDHDSELAMLLANGYVTEMSRLIRAGAVSEALQRQQFFGRQLSIATANLDAIENALKHGRETHGLGSASGAAGIVVSTASELRTRISEKKIQIDAIRAFVTTENFSFARLLAELDSLETELSKLQNGAGARSGAAPPVSPSGADQQNGNALRELNYSQVLINLLRNQYELARVDIAEGGSDVQVLDPALLPEAALKPQRGLFVFLMTIAALIVATAGAFVAEARCRRLAWSSTHSGFTKSEVQAGLH